MRFFLDIVLVLALGLGLGGALSQVSIQNNSGFSALTIGQWTAWPRAGSRDADPYTKAKVAAVGEVPLGAAEGIAFHGRLDGDGQPLDLKCNYTVSGQTPLARFWTLTAHAQNGDVITSAAGNASMINSRSLIRQSNGTFLVSVGQELRGGNWIQTSGAGTFELIVRLYDSQITSAEALVEPQMPAITLKGCRS